MVSANLRAFLYMIRWCEGTSDENGYSRIVGGSSFGSWDDHPRIVKSGVFSNGKAWTSSAAGAYQFLMGTWDECKEACNLPDFSPASQDQAAIYLIKRRGALHAVEDGNIRQAIWLCSKEWASLPGSPYGQPVKSLEACLDTFVRAGGILSQSDGTTPQAPPEDSRPVPVPTAPSSGGIMAIPALVTAAASALLPIVADLFRARGTKTSTRNAEVIDQVSDVAPALISIAKTVVGHGNEQQVAEAILGNKDLQQQFRAQVALQWSDIEPFLRFEEESREKARDFATALTAGDGWRSVGAGALVGLLSLFIIVGGGVLFWDMMYNPNLDPGQKGLILGALIAVFGQAAAFWFGSSRSSQTKDQTIADQARK